MGKKKCIVINLLASCNIFFKMKTTMCGSRHEPACFIGTNLSSHASACINEHQACQGAKVVVDKI